MKIKERSGIKDMNKMIMIQDEIGFQGKKPHTSAFL